jgi:divalent metal cation (Fe/Co/Zn/Cd) transporter
MGTTREIGLPDRGRRSKWLVHDLPTLPPAMDSPRDRHHLQRRALRLEYGTIAWNVGEAFLTIGMGSVAGSLALIGFGTVSVVEVFASGVVVWHVRSGDDGDAARRTRTALRLIAVAFVVLAATLLTATISDLVNRRVPGESLWGIVYLAITALVMLGLAVAKRRTAIGLDSGPLRSEAAVTFLDAALSVSTLLGLALNAFAGWWWADPLAAGLVAIAALNEGREAWSEASEGP